MNKLDQHIKNKLSQPQVPPLDAWKNIQEKLDEKEKKRRIIPLFYWIGSTAACLVIGIGVFYFNQEETSSSNKPAQEVVKNNSNSSLEKQQSSKSNKNNSDTTNQNSIHNKIKEENTLNENSLQLTHKETKQNNNIHLENNSPTYTTTSIEEKRMLVAEKPHKSLFFDGKGDAFVIFPEKLSAENTIISQPKFEQNNIAKSKKDSITKKEILDQILNEKPLELVLEEEQKEVEKKKEKINISSPKFVVSSYVNPTKMLDSKSILSDEFNQNNINNSLTIAYGAKVAVRLNDKINIRSGISKIELEQHTNSVGTMSNNAMAYLANSNINLNAQNNIKYDQNYTRVLANNNVGTMLSSSMGEMEQQIHYVEIPLELEYKLANFKKFNLLATAGGSYYLVTKNQISLKDTNSRSVRIGEASNLNDMNYSANAGLKLEYLLSEKTSINLEPNYRYMINTVHNVETRNPSLLGLNLGFSIKF
jgi:hypothetical protein